MLTTKQLKNRETTILTPVSHLARYCIQPGREISRYYMPQMQGRKNHQGFCFSIFIREQHEDLIKQMKKNVIHTLTHIHTLYCTAYCRVMVTIMKVWENSKWPEIHLPSARVGRCSL